MIKGLTILLLLLLLASVCSGATVARIQNIPHEHISPEFIEPFEFLNHFLNAVERGELELYGRQIDSSMLEPTHVEYVYQLDTMTRSVKIYAKLLQPIIVPELRRVKIVGISVFLDPEGSIGEILVHVEAE